MQRQISKSLILGGSDTELSQKRKVTKQYAKRSEEDGLAHSRKQTRAVASSHRKVTLESCSLKNGAGIRQVFRGKFSVTVGSAVVLWRVREKTASKRWLKATESLICALCAWTCMEV